MNCPALNIVHVIPSVGPGSFGIGPVALNLAQEQNSLGFSADIWCLDAQQDISWAAESVGLPVGRIRTFRRSGPGFIGYSCEMAHAAFEYANPLSTVIHQHGIWYGLSRITCTLGKVTHTPTVVAPHGSLEQWALKKSWWKKQLALACYERENLQTASCLHACSEQEIAGFRDFGLTNPIAVIPNGISHNWLESTGDAQLFREQHRIPPEKRVMLFLSRITPVKGLFFLLDALQSIRDHLDDWLVIIAGADEFGHLKEVQAKIRELHLEGNIRFSGLLTGQTKRDAFAAAELFVLPTKRENYGIVIAEALGAGVPVLTTKGAPWKDLETYNSGWWVDVTAGAIAMALKEALACSPEQLRDMGLRGKSRAAIDYTWSKSARKSIELYEWLLGRQDKPEFVVVD